MGNCQNELLLPMSPHVFTMGKMSIYDKNYYKPEPDADNDIMKFLIVLSLDDFKANCWPFKRYSTSVKNSGSYLSGQLDIISINDISQRNKKKNLLKYKINEIVNLKTLYIKLPKENMYVKSDVWQFEYMKSQIREIIHIFGLLGAKSVDYRVLSSKLSSFEFGSSVSAGNIPIESGLKVNNKNGLSTEISGNITYQIPERFPTTSTILSSNNIYYLIRKDDWKDICERRIINKATIDNFTYKFNTDVSFSFKVIEKFRKLGISFNISSDETKNFTMEFKVNYYTEKNIILQERDNCDNISNNSIDSKNDIILQERDNCDNISNNSIHSENDMCFRKNINVFSDNDLETTYYHSDDEYGDKKNYLRKSSLAIKKSSLAIKK
jgi:hypothetical protein